MYTENVCPGIRVTLATTDFVIWCDKLAESWGMGEYLTLPLHVSIFNT